MDPAAPTPPADHETPPTALGRAVAQRFSWHRSLVARPRPTIGRLAGAATRFGSLVGRPITARRALAPATARAASAATAGLPVATPLSPALAAWWALAHAPDLDPPSPATSTRKAPVAPLPPRGLPRAARPGGATRMGPGTAPGGAAPRFHSDPVPLRQDPEVAAVGSVLTTRETRFSTGSTGRQPVPAPPGHPNRPPGASAPAGATATSPAAPAAPRADAASLGRPRDGGTGRPPTGPSRSSSPTARTPSPSSPSPSSPSPGSGAARAAATRPSRRQAPDGPRAGRPGPATVASLRAGATATLLRRTATVVDAGTGPGSTSTSTGRSAAFSHLATHGEMTRRFPPVRLATLRAASTEATRRALRPGRLAVLDPSTPAAPAAVTTTPHAATLAPFATAPAALARLRSATRADDPNVAASLLPGAAGPGPAPLASWRAGRLETALRLPATDAPRLAAISAAPPAGRVTAGQASLVRRSPVAGEADEQAAPGPPASPGTSLPPAARPSAEPRRGQPAGRTAAPAPTAANAASSANPPARPGAAHPSPAPPSPAPPSSAPPGLAHAGAPGAPVGPVVRRRSAPIQPPPGALAGSAHLAATLTSATRTAGPLTAPIGSLTAFGPLLSGRGPLTSAARALAGRAAPRTTATATAAAAATATATATARTHGAARIAVASPPHRQDVPAPRQDGPSATRFLDALTEHRPDPVTALPRHLQPLATAIAGPAPVQVRSGRGTAAALAAAGKRAATVGRVIHLPAPPDRTAADTEVVAHELVHAARPSTGPRFFGDDHHDDEETLARRVGSLARSLTATDGAPAPGRPDLLFGTAGLPVVPRQTPGTGERRLDPSAGIGAHRAGPARTGWNRAGASASANPDARGGPDRRGGPAPLLGLHRRAVPTAPDAGDGPLTDLVGAAPAPPGRPDRPSRPAPPRGSLRHLPRIGGPTVEPTFTPPLVEVDSPPLPPETLEWIIERVERHVIDELERRGLRHNPGVF